MIAPLFDTCMLCGRPVRRAGERLCVYHDIQFLINQGPERLRERVRKAGRRVQTLIPKINQPKEIT